MGTTRKSLEFKATGLTVSAFISACVFANCGKSSHLVIIFALDGVVVADIVVGGFVAVV